VSLNRKGKVAGGRSKGVEEKNFAERYAAAVGLGERGQKLKARRGGSLRSHVVRSPPREEGQGGWGRREGLEGKIQGRAAVWNSLRFLEKS